MTRACGWAKVRLIPTALESPPQTAGPVKDKAPLGVACRGGVGAAARWAVVAPSACGAEGVFRVCGSERGMRVARGKVGTARLEAKAAVVGDVASRLREASATVVVDFRGLNVGDDGELRRKLRGAGVEYRVLKNTVVTRAARDAGIEGLEGMLRGPTAVAFSEADPTAAARELLAFAKDHQQLVVKGGVLDGQVIGPQQVEALAAVPPREVLLTQVAVALSGPLVAMARVLAAPLRDLATVTEQLAKQRDSAGAA